jgi:hypothetical protein
MTSEERTLCAYQLLIKIHAITGWTIPVSELMNVLADQFEKKLLEKYRNVNEQEVEYAFRNKGIEIKDWGKAMNLSLIDEVMIPYLEERFELSRTEEQAANTKIMIEEPKTLTDEDKAEWIMDWKVMPEINIELIPLMFYDFLNDQKIITLTNEQKWKYAERAQHYVKSQLHEAMSNTKTNDALLAFGKFEKMEREGFEGEFKGRILNRAKRLVVYDYLKGYIE